MSVTFCRSSTLTSLNSMKTYMYFVIYVFSSDSIKVSCSFQVIDGDPKSPACDLASPDMIHSINNTELSIGLDLLQHGDKAWLGYTKVMQPFQYLGCISHEDASSDEDVTFEEIPTVLDLGICFHKCSGLNMPIFGLQGDGDKPCKCFRGEIKELEAESTNCNVKCSNGKYWCGGHRHISLYESVDRVNAGGSTTGDDKCLSTNRNRYFWKDCHERHGAGCQKEWQTSWDVKFGYVERIGNAYVLDFTTDRNTTSKMLCLKEYDENTTLTSATTPSTFITTDVDVTITWSTREGNSSEIDQAHFSAVEGKRSIARVAFYVGVPVGILLIIAIIVVFIVIRKRRYKLSRGNDQEVESMNNENEYDIYNDGEDDTVDQYQEVEYEDKPDDVYEMPNEETDNLHDKGEAGENQYDTYEESSTEQKHEYVYAGQVERDNTEPLKNMPEPSNEPSIGNYFVLEKEKTQVDENMKMPLETQISRAYNHVQISTCLSSGGGFVDEYDHIGNVTGPITNRKDYDQTTINNDNSDTYDNTTNVLIKSGDENTDNP